MTTDQGKRDTGTVIDAKLASGRGIWCFQYLVSYTYNGFLERTPSEECDRYMLQGVEREAKRVFGDWPVHILQPARTAGVVDFPRKRFTAFFTSLPMKQDMHVSSLVLAWFQDDQFPPMNEATLSAVRSLDWERLAVDYEL
jgi:hypothetical protein